MTLLAAQTQSVLRASESIDDAQFASIRQRLALDWCKWDPQVGDISTIAPFAILLPAWQWQSLARDAESLYDEAIAAERELLHRPELTARLGLPRKLCRILHEGPTPPHAPRVMRFDFHWTTDGWRISEANSDVPGGYAESGPLAAMLSEYLPGTHTAGDPGAAYAEAITDCADGKPVALLSAAGFMEDHQVVSHLARRLRTIGVDAIHATLSQLNWRDGTAHLDDQPLGAIVRFVQAEWLSKSPRSFPWQNFFVGRTPVTNCAASILTESKRFGLLFDELSTDMPTWRELLPETREVRDVDWKNAEDWLLKTAICNTGDTVTLPDGPPKLWRRARLNAFCFPRSWLAQRRFHVVGLPSPLGVVYPCIGVYVIDGRAAGIYGRISRKHVIDFEAIDVAVLIEPASLQ